MKERRIYQRTSVELPAYYHLLKEDDLSHQATVVNISAGGFCFYTQHALPNGTAVELTIQLGKEGEITINAVTAWSKKIGDTGDFMIGVKINQAKGSDLEKFLSFYCKEISLFLTELQNIKKG